MPICRRSDARSASSTASFVISFAGQMRPACARPYLEAVAELLECSQRYRVPLYGFVDSSYSRDLVTLIELLAHTPNALTLGDARCWPRVCRSGEIDPVLCMCTRRLAEQ